MDARKIQNIIFFSMLGIVTLLFLYLLKPFFTPIFWAAVTAGILKPLYQRLQVRLKKPNLSATLMVLIFALLILLPAAMITSLLVKESIQLYNSINADTSGIQKEVQDITNRLTHNFYTNKFQIDDQVIIQKFSEAAKGIADYIFIHLTDLTQNTLVFLIQFGVMIYTLFFFFRDGDRILVMLKRMIPLGKSRVETLYERFIAAARATLKATVLLGGLQGLLGGFIFFITGIEGYMIWGLLMVVMAILPGIGCSIIWAPAGLIMLLNGNVWEGVTILTFGVLVISVGDNMLRPILIGGDVEMHSLTIFLSTLGGLVLFGLSGFVIGPIVAALFMTLWDMSDQYFDDPLSDQ
jgi:predicted PurR-regulated permease PerM